MNSIVLLIFFVILEIIHATNLRCYDDHAGSIRLIEHCRACIIYIDIKLNMGQISPKNIFDYDRKHSHQRRELNTQPIVHQKCAREFDGPLYGYDQTHCYCNSNLCNSNIQGCIYEIVSKRYFSCYHGSNSSGNSLEINKKCRSCRIRKESSLTYHYECLTFGEQEQRSTTHCTCQHPMCNQDFAICQRFQQIPSQPRVNVIHEIVRNTTKTFPPTTTTTTTTTTSTNPPVTISMINQTELELSTENVTSIELTSISSNETTQTNSIRIEMKNHARLFSMHFLFYLLSFFLVCDQ